MYHTVSANAIYSFQAHDNWIFGKHKLGENSSSKICHIGEDLPKKGISWGSIGEILKVLRHLVTPGCEQLIWVCGRLVVT